MKTIAASPLPARIRAFSLSGSVALAAAMLVAAAAFGQSIDGNWQGTLEAPQRPLRLVMKVTSEDGALKAVFYSIDQNGPGVSASAVSLQGSTFKATLPAIGGSFEGKLDAERTTIRGTLTQGAARPLVLVKATPATAWAIPDPPAPRRLMSTDAQPAFEVATIKPSSPEASGRGITVGRGGGNAFATRNTSLAELIQFAYVVHEKQVTGGPSWIESEKFDVLAKPDTPGIPNAPQLRAMVQKLLAERFGLKFHREKKELAAYALTADKDGIKMAKAEGPRSQLPGVSGRGPGAIAVRNATMADFAQFLQSRLLERPVVDQTGLEGRYDFTLEWKPDAPQGVAPGEANSAALADRPDLMTAMRQQLGVKMESRKVAVDVLAIDKVARPTEN